MAVEIVAGQRALKMERVIDCSNNTWRDESVRLSPRQGSRGPAPAQDGRFAGQAAESLRRAIELSAVNSERNYRAAIR